MKGNLHRQSICVVRTTCGAQEARLFEEQCGKGQTSYNWIAGTIRPRADVKAIGQGSIVADNRDDAIKQFREHLQLVTILPSAKLAGGYVSSRLEQIMPRVTDRNDPFASPVGHAVLERHIPITASSLRVLEVAA